MEKFTMFLKTWRFITIILAALSMGMAFCHVLELPAKMNYPASLYLTIQQSLYWQFGSFPGIFSEVGAIFGVIALTVFVRKRQPAFFLTLAGAIFLALALVIWFLFVAPMNAEFAQWTVDSIPANWTQVRNQWEYSHATRFVLQLIGFSALLISILAETSKNRSRDRVTSEVAHLTKG
jgi:ABC-type xylose transport system permease subunit